MRSVQTGAAGLPGFGVQAGYVMPRTFYTLDGVLYADLAPPYGEGEGSLLTSLGFGASLRLLGLFNTFGDERYEGSHLDLGLRFGPSLRFRLDDETLQDKNTRFGLFLDTFVRFTTQLGNGRTVYGELGTQRPHLRAGLWFDL